MNNLRPRRNREEHIRWKSWPYDLVAVASIVVVSNSLQETTDHLLAASTSIRARDQRRRRHQVTTDSDDENDPKAIVVLPTPEAPGTPGQRRNTLGCGPPHGRDLAPDQEASQGYGAAPCTCPHAPCRRNMGAGTDELRHPVGLHGVVRTQQAPREPGRGGYNRCADSVHLEEPAPFADVPSNKNPGLWDAIEQYNIPAGGGLNARWNGARTLEWTVIDADGGEEGAGESYRPFRRWRDKVVSESDAGDEEHRARQRTLVGRSESSDGRHWSSEEERGRVQASYEKECKQSKDDRVKMYKRQPEADFSDSNTQKWNAWGGCKDR
jgi:hypothetical protein